MFHYWKIFQIREVYETLVIYFFVRLLIEYAGGHDALADATKDNPPMRHTWPLTCIKFKPGWYADAVMEAWVYVDAERIIWITSVVSTRVACSVHYTQGFH